LKFPLLNEIPESALWRHSGFCFLLPRKTCENNCANPQAIEKNNLEAQIADSEKSAKEKKQ
jgi:hypothetical protein